MEYEIMPPIDDGPDPLLDGICSNGLCPSFDAGCPDVNGLCGANIGCNCGSGWSCAGGGGNTGGGGSW